MATTLARLSLRTLLTRVPPGSAKTRLVLPATAAMIGKRIVGSVRSPRADVGVPRSVPVCVAYELQKAGHRYLDVRAEGEFSGGHPVGAVNIPYMFKDGSGK